MLGGRDPNRASKLFPKFTQGRELRLDFFKPRTHGLKQALPASVGEDAARGAREQPKPEPFLKSTDRVTDAD
jgi:hypothetical protein